MYSGNGFKPSVQKKISFYGWANMWKNRTGIKTQTTEFRINNKLNERFESAYIPKATGWNSRGSNSVRGKRISKTFSPALGPTPPIQWLPRLFPWREAAGAWCWPPTPMLMPKLRMRGAAGLTTLPLYVSGAWTGKTSRLSPCPIYWLRLRHLSA